MPFLHEYPYPRRETIARPPIKPNKPEGPRTNQAVRAPKVRLIDADGENRGVVSTEEALKIAERASLDLVEISPNAEPPVAKIMDYGRFKYQEQKKKNEAKKKQKVSETKEIKMRPNIDTHDYQTKMKAVQRFLDGGDKVKFTIRFRGRELTHQELGMNVLKRAQEDLGESVKVESHAKMEGRQMVMIVAPK